MNCGLLTVMRNQKNFDSMKKTIKKYSYTYMLCQSCDYSIEGNKILVFLHCLLSGAELKKS